MPGVWGPHLCKHRCVELPVRERNRSSLRVRVPIVSCDKKLDTCCVTGTTWMFRHVLVVKHSEGRGPWFGGKGAQEKGVVRVICPRNGNLRIGLFLV